MECSKRGQAAAGAAVLIAIIAALLIMFVILIPPQERAKLLGDEEVTAPGKKVDTAKIEKTLLTEKPGRIDYLAQKEIEHPLPVVNIYTRTESKILAEKNIASAKKGIFSEDVSEFPFVIADLKNTENMLLSFTVKRATGKMIISLNGEEIYNNIVSVGAVQPITLPKNLLQDQNTLTFSVSSPGFAFWRTNDLSLESIKIVADVQNVEAQFSKNVFIVSETEQKNVEKTSLKFQPECMYSEVGKLTITINANEMYNAVPDCEVKMVPLEFSPLLLQLGENELVFSTEKGTYVLSSVVVESALREVDFPTYYFDLSFEQHQDIKDGKFRVRVTMDFVDVVTAKTGEIVFNGKVKHFDTKEVSFTIDVSDDIVQGNNALKIKPKKTIEIRELRVELVKK